MMKRYVSVFVIIVKNEIIPLYDPRVKFVKDTGSESGGNYVTFDNSYNKIYELNEAVFDLKTKTYSAGISVDIYPVINDKTEFKKGMTVLFEAKHRHLETVKIEDIVYESYEMQIRKGKKIEEYYSKHITDLNPDALYCIKIWKSCYVLSNGIKTEWSHQMWHIAK